VLSAARAMALSILLQARQCFAGFNRESQLKPAALVRSSRSSLRTKSIMGKRRSGLPVGNGAVRSEVRVSACRDRFCNLGDLFQLFEVEFNPDSRSLVRVELSVLEVKAYG
jgi:hypothetical protein